MTRWMMEYLNSCQTVGKTTSCSVVSLDWFSCRWQPPEDRWFKLNVDAAFHNSGSGFNSVLRDKQGKVFLFGVGPLVGVLTTDHAELMALWLNFEKIHEFWTAALLIATDCQQLVL